MQFLETAFYFAATLGVLVFVHELGHFLAAKMCRMRVDRFSIGFPPRAFGKKIGETDYCVSWIPIGGYVKIAGMIDESFDTEHLGKAPEPWEFRSKPLWQRMFVISAGVLMNLLLAVLIFWAINLVQGRTIRQTTEVGWVAPDGPAAAGGLQAGDIILGVDGRPAAHWEEVLEALEGAPRERSLRIMRLGQERNLVLPPGAPDNLGMGPAHTEVVVSAVEPGMPADRARLRPLDVILTLGGIPVADDRALRRIVQAHAGKELPVTWRREGRRMQAVTVPTEGGLIGIQFGARYIGPSSRAPYGPLEALFAGTRNVLNAGLLFAHQVQMILTGRAAFSQSVGGPIRIAQMATQTAEMGLLTYFGFMALLSISLALLNILPFPALDGGHLLFLLYEGVFRREIPARVKILVQKAGFAILIAFMAFVLYNDIMNF
ncbi:MAG: RIP metalloprotease RseP [Bacteroidota bacterium]